MTIKRDQLAHLPDAFLMCRSSMYRHGWDDFIPRKREWEIEPDVCMRCTRCGTEKFIWLDAGGNYACHPVYEYPEGYTLAGLYRGDRLTAAELRVEVIGRKRTKGSGKARRLRVA